MRSVTASAVTTAFLLALSGLAAPARADAGQPPVHGCPSGDLCTYGSQAAYDRNVPTGTALTAIGFGLTGTGPDAAVVNNTDPMWTSEGSFVLELGGLLCVYVPDQNDVQASDTAEDPADGQANDAFAAGPTETSVTATVQVGLGDCV